MGNPWNLPHEEVSCPACGKIYGHDGTTVCRECEECSSCHDPKICRKPEFISADTFVEKLFS